MDNEALGARLDQAAKDAGLAWGTVNGWVNGFFALLPNLVVAFVVVFLFVLLGLLVRFAVRKVATRRDRANLGTVLGRFLQWVVIFLGVLLGLTIVLPSLKPGDLVAGLGVTSVAIGFAFKDILQNWLAGLLLLFQQPFRVGDQIVVEGYEGTIERVETRATILKTYDGRRVVIPNATIYSNSVTVNTAFPTRRSEYDVGIGYGDDIKTAKATILEAMRGANGVLSEPPPEVIPWALDSSAVMLRARWWTNPFRSDVVRVQGEVVEAVKYALDAAGIDMPYDTQVFLLHDQTEDTDGQRGAQREGWPKRQKDEPRPRWRVLEEGREAK
ncbi:MAG: mechanosensitive ion channel family protein [Geminicoccaceae bacterium]|nr:mechanosensitive ion channel family protein [Geminicoccaceae bacterium]